MSDQAALLAAIRANPDEDTPRLAYADWLDEHLPDAVPSPARGPSARADYIRVQCRLAQRPYDDPEYPALLEREEELAQWLNARNPDAYPKLPDDLECSDGFSYGSDETYRRGFPEEVEFTDYDEEPEENVDRITAALPQAFDTTTIRTLFLNDVYGAEVAGIAAHPVSAGLRGLFLDYVADDDEAEAVRGLARSEHMTGLRRLALEFPLELADVQALAKTRNLDALESLALDQSTPAGMKALGAAKWFRNLRALRLWMTDRETFRAIGDLPPMPNLVALTISGHVTPSAAAFRRFAASESFPRLGKLEIERTQLAPELVAALCRAPWPLRHLKLREVAVRRAGAEALANATFADSLRVLELLECNITSGGVQALAASPKFAGLKHLYLNDNPIGPGGLAALARSPHLRGLRLLDLGRCNSTKAPIDAAAVLNFLNGLDLPELRHLILDHLPIGVRGAKVLAAGGTFANLTNLELSDCGLRETGAKAIVESASLANLTALDLSYNNAGKGVLKLSSAKTFPRLGHCNLAGNRLPKAVLARLRKRPGVSVQPMNEADALLAAIRAHPDDDTPRLVYADWLQENGRAEEGEFLRTQCRLAAADPDDPEYPALVDRDEELRLWLSTHAPGPRPTFPGGLSVDGAKLWWWQARRGFPRFLEFDGYERYGVKAMRGLASALARAFEALPTRWLVVRFVTVAQLTALLKQPVLAGLSHLTVQLSATAGESNDAAKALAGCRHLRNLRGLLLYVPFGDAGCEALATGPWSGLEWFATAGHDLTPAGLSALAGSDWFRGLRALTLEDGLPTETFEALGRLPALPRLHTLDLSRHLFPERAWQRFGETRALPALTRLDLTNGDLSGERFAALAGAAGFALSALNARECGPGAGSGAALAAAPWAGALRVLNLGLNGLAPADVKALVARKRLTELRHLDLSGNALGPTGLSALAANPALRGLRALRLDGRAGHSAALTPAHFDRFLAKLNMPELRHLDLSGRPVGATAAKKLAAPKFASLRRLSLKDCKLSDPAVAKLVAAPALRNLIQLDLNDNGLKTGPKKLGDPSVMPDLAACSLTGNPIAAPVARKLRQRPGVIGLPKAAKRHA